MPSTLDRQTLGKLGEDLACRELSGRGYAILARRYRSRFGEIDIVCRDGDAIVFVEVRARKTARAGRAAESLVPRKRRRLAAMALDYLAWTHQIGSRCRFDVVAIDGLGGPTPVTTVHESAFEVG